MSALPSKAQVIEALKNLAQVEVSLADLLDQLGAVDGERIDDVVDEFAKLHRQKLKDARASQPPGKRVRLFLRAERPVPAAPGQPPGGG